MTDDIIVALFEVLLNCYHSNGNKRKNQFQLLLSSDNQLIDNSM